MTRVIAGGGGENMLLVVNPNDENSLRIATAYAQARNIPDRNICMLPPQVLTYADHLPSTQLVWYQYTTYVNPIKNFVSSRNLAGQIDYIGALGQPYEFAASSYNWQSVGYVLSRMNDIYAQNNDSGAASANNISYNYSPFYQDPSSYALNTNTAIHTLSGAAGSGNNWSMGGMVGWTGMFGNSADQVIKSLQRSAAADGTKPQGTVYFEVGQSGSPLSEDIRSTIRDSASLGYAGTWDTTAPQLAARGIPTVHEIAGTGGTPTNRTDVRGATIGVTWTNLPNGSTYLPGSWADNLTSLGASFKNDLQHLSSTALIAAGAAATSGSVEEPGANNQRFPNTNVHVYSADGSTLGEAYYKATAVPDIVEFIGDSLAQPYADVPKVAFNPASTPADGSTVNGSISLNATATLPTNATLAKAVAKLQLYIDGKPVGSPVVNSGSGGLTGSIPIDTSTLSDGRHELRVVALNDAAAASEGAGIINVYVNNHGESVVANGANNITATANQVVAVPVNAVTGSATLSRVELRNLGRSVGQTTSSTGSISLDVSQLAYGNNPVVPVEVFSDGTEVAGTPITVTRNPNYLAGTTPSAPSVRTPGIKAEYFLGKGQNRIANVDFSGQPDIVTTNHKLAVERNSTQTSFPWTDLPELMPTTAANNLDKLAARFSGSFQVTSANVGEFTFFPYTTNDSAKLLIDGQQVFSFDTIGLGMNNGYNASGSIFLGAGEHTFTYLTSNLDTTPNTFPGYSGNQHQGFADFALWMRGPDGVNQPMSDAFVYQVPEPVSLTTLLGLAGVLLCGVRRRVEQYPENCG